MPSDNHSISPVVTTTTDPRFSGSGSFVLGTTATFFFYFTDISGRLYDPSDLTITIKDPSGDTVETSDSADKIDEGTFGFSWKIPSDAVTGKYSIIVKYVVEKIDGPVTESFTEYFIVVEKGPGGFTLRQIASRAFLETLLGETQRIPVFNEIARFNKAKTVGELTFPRWNQTAGAKIYINGQLKESGYDIDYYRGRVAFGNTLSTFDEVTVDYNFRWFTDNQLDQFVEQGVNLVNIYPPASVYTILNIPDRWVIAAEYGAAVNSLRSLLISLCYQSPAKIFGGLERAKEVFTQLESLKRNYEDSLKMLLEQKKRGPYPTSRTITTPEFALPGGRSRWFRYLMKGA